MALVNGQKLGPYQIESAVGAGGMGEVYKARDSRLDRIVAIKVLPSTTSFNVDLRTRFEREAKAISSLNHPNICTLYDVGHENGIDYLVMEYIEGETLSDRIKRGAPDIRDAIEIGIQISNALDLAHRHNLVHRDLKPSNVMLTKSGAKLLDFGLAKLKVSDGIVEGTAAETQTTPLTGTGTIIGTLQYMSPEQLEGKPADARSDIFAFGAVIYEMVTGRKAFEGKSQASLIAAIMEKEPTPISAIKPMYPPALDRLVHKCLEKDPDKRWQSASDLADELRWISQSGSQAGVSPAVSAKRRFKFQLAWVIATASILIAIAALGWILTRPEPEVFSRRFRIETNPGTVWASWPQISPDGKYIAYRAGDSANVTMIWIRPLNALESYALPGTENARRPFWSPDSKYLGFTNDDKVKRISISGGPAQLLGEAPHVADGSWGSAGVILLDGNFGDSIRAVPASGGQITGVTKIDRSQKEKTHMWPQFLPDGKHFLYLAATDSIQQDPDYQLKAGSVDSDESVTIITINSLVRYADPGYLIFMRDKILMAQKFDPADLKLTGEPQPITDKVGSVNFVGAANFSVSHEGTLIMSTSDKTARSELKWFDRSGRELATIGEPGRYGNVAISPTGTQIAYTVEDDKNSKFDIWIHDINRDVASRLTFEAENETGPIWTPDGQNVVYTKGDWPAFSTYSKSADGSGTGQLFPPPDTLIRFINDISPDGLNASYTTIRNSQPDIQICRLSTDTNNVEIIASKFAEYGARFSPDGLYVVYGSEESGKSEIYVKRSDGTGGKWQVSTNGGEEAIWNKNGKELVYRTADENFMAVSVNTKGTFESGTPVKLFRQRLDNLGGGANWDISSDGQKFLLITPQGTASAPSFEIVLDWTKELEAR